MLISPRSRSCSRFLNFKTIVSLKLVVSLSSHPDHEFFCPERNTSDAGLCTPHCIACSPHQDRDLHVRHKLIKRLQRLEMHVKGKVSRRACMPTQRDGHQRDFRKPDRNVNAFESSSSSGNVIVF